MSVGKSVLSISLLIGMVSLLIVTGCEEQVTTTQADTSQLKTEDQANAESSAQEQATVTHVHDVSSEESTITETFVEKTPEPASGTKVKLQTTMGDIIIELFEKDCPVTCGNIIKYANDGFYNDTIFHRVINGFMIQCGGLSTDMVKKKTNPPIVNEFKHSNVRGTAAMAKRGGNPDSATSQFFINLADNSPNLDNQNGGFTVFGKVVEGMDIVDRIAKVKTGNSIMKVQLPSGQIRPVPISNVPVEPVIIKSVSVIRN